MALTLNPATKEFTILQADLTFVSGTVYDLDTDQFRKDAMTLCASEDYIWMPNPYNHNPEVTIVGTTYARTVEFINGYNITFENNTYSVRLQGSNNNIFDVDNGILNPSGNVTIISGNSAGLIKNENAALGQGDLDNIEDAVWDATRTDHLIADTMGDWFSNKLLTVSKFLGLSD
jgi:hypothetical protein